MKVQVIYELSYDKNSMNYNLRVDGKLISAHTTQEDAEKAYASFIELNSKKVESQLIKETIIA